MKIFEMVFLFIVGVPLLFMFLYGIGAFVLAGFAGVIFFTKELFDLFLRPEINEEGDGVVKVEKIKEALKNIGISVLVVIGFMFYVFF